LTAIAQMNMPRIVIETPTKLTTKNGWSLCGLTNIKLVKMTKYIMVPIKSFVVMCAL